MDSKEEKMFLENLEEFVLDEDKIVTYKWLSKTFNIHVNTAKQLLFKYAMPNNVRRSNVHMTFLIGGVLNDGTGKIQIVGEDDVDKVKERFKMVTSEHVYSVQKASKIPDLNILFGIDNLKIETSEDRLGAITCKKAVRRLDNDIASLRVKALGTTAVTKNKPFVASKKTQPQNHVSSNQSSEMEIIEVKPANPKASEVEPAKAKTIASMFTAQNKKPASNNNNKSSVTNTSVKKEKGGIASFFPKQAEKPPIDTKDAIFSINKESENKSKTIKGEDDPIATNGKTEMKAVKDESATPLKTKEKIEINKKAPKLSRNKKEQKSSEKNEENDKTSKNKRGKKKKLSEEDAKPAKKRKRIMVMSDSSSEDDIFGDDDNDDVEMKPASPDIPPEDQQSVLKSQDISSDEDIIPPTPVAQTEKGNKSRNRVRKLVDKTFTDEDGYIITKKEYVYESCSDGESGASTIKKTDDGKKKTKENDTGVDVDSLSTKDVEEEKEPSPKTGKKGSTKSKKQPTKKTPPVVSDKSKQQSIMNFFSKPK